MQFDIYRTVEELDTISNEWNELLSCCSASHVPFLRCEYLRSWWQTLGGGDWQEGELYVVIGRAENGDLIGIAPLFYTYNRFGEPALMLLGSIEISDYLDLIVHCDDQSVFIDGLLSLLDSDRLPDWRVLDWYNIPENSPTLVCLQEAVRRCGWSYQQEQLQPCPYIPLPGDWETYLAGIDKKQRHEIRRKMRRVEESDLPVHWYFVQDEDELDSEVDRFMDLMAQDPEKDQFLSQVMLDHVINRYLRQSLGVSHDNQVGINAPNLAGTHVTYSLNWKANKFLWLSPYAGYHVYEESYGPEDGLYDELFDYVGVGLKGDYRLGKNWGLSLKYGYRLKDSESTAYGYAYNRVVLTATYHF